MPLSKTLLVDVNIVIRTLLSCFLQWSELSHLLAGVWIVALLFGTAAEHL